MPGLFPQQDAPPDQQQPQGGDWQSGDPAQQPAAGDSEGASDQPQGQDEQEPGKGGDEVGAAPNVTPEEQQQYEHFVVNCANTISDPHVLPTVRDMLKHDPDPVDALARIASMIVVRVEDDAAQKGVPVDHDVVFHAGAAVVGDVADVAQRLGIHKYTQDQINAAFLRAVDMYRAVRVKQGKIDPQEAQQEFDQIKKLDQTGQLGQIMPGLKEFAAQNAGAVNARPGELPAKGMSEGAPQ